MAHTKLPLREVWARTQVPDRTLSELHLMLHRRPRTPTNRDTAPVMMHLTQNAAVAKEAPSQSPKSRGSTSQVLNYHQLLPPWATPLGLPQGAPAGHPLRGGQQLI